MNNSRKNFYALLVTFCFVFLTTLIGLYFLNNTQTQPISQNTKPEEVIPGFKKEDQNTFSPIISNIIEKQNIQAPLESFSVTAETNYQYTYKYQSTLQFNDTVKLYRNKFIKGFDGWNIQNMLQEIGKMQAFILKGKTGDDVYITINQGNGMVTVDITIIKPNRTKAI